jgi:hypothetical protein
MARRDEGEYPSWIFDWGATKPAGPWRENPPGGGSFGCGLRWLAPYSPLRGCAGLAASPTAKIPRRSTLPNFQTGSKMSEALHGRQGDEQDCAHRSQRRGGMHARQAGELHARRNRRQQQHGANKRHQVNEPHSSTECSRGSYSLYCRCSRYGPTAHRRWND